MAYRTSSDVILLKEQIRAKPLISFLGLVLISFINSAFGAEQEPNTTAGPEMPDLEFLEFLGQFETDEGEWMDPSSLMADEFTVLLNAAMVPDPNSDTTDIDDDDQQSNQ